MFRNNHIFIELSIHSFKKCSCVPYLAVSNTLVNFGTQKISSSHLSYVHPARVATLLHFVPEGFHLILGVPLVTDENLGWIFVCVCVKLENQEHCNLDGFSLVIKAKLSM